MLNDILGGKGEFDLGAIGDLLGNGGAQNILQQLSQGGLGDVVQSWLGKGENLPVSADQLQAILGNEQLNQIASRFGIDPHQIATLLPGLIDKLSPNGHLAEGGLGDLIGGFLGDKGGNIAGDLLGGLFKR